MLNHRPNRQPRNGESEVSFEVPAPVSVVRSGGAVQQVAFGAFVADTLLRDRRWGTSLGALRMGRDLLLLMSSAPVGSRVRVPAKTWRLLAAVASEPQFPQRDGTTGGYDPLPAMALLGFIEAICDAQPDERGNDGKNDDAKADDSAAGGSEALVLACPADPARAATPA